MKKSKYSLKKVYESVFKLTKEDRQSDINADFQRRILARNPANVKTLKALYAANDDDIINQTISTEIPGLGTFDLTPVQIGLIGCIDQYFYGDKQLALNLINVLKTGQSVESEQTSQKVHLAAGHIRENKKNKKQKSRNNLIKKPKGWRLKMDAMHAKEFIDDCVSHKILIKENNMYSINDGYTISQNKYSISRSSGLLFEMFLCFNIEKWFGEDNVNSTINVERLANYAQVSYILSILCVIYNILDYDLIITVNKEEIKNTVDKSRELYKKLNLDNKNIFEKFLDDTFKSNKSELYFDFQQEQDAPLDFYVRKKSTKNVITMFDLKTSTVGSVVTELSSSFNSANDQIYKIFNEEPEDGDKIVYNNFYISSLNILYSYNNEGVEIDETLCLFIDFKKEYRRIEAAMNKEVDEGENRSFRFDKNKKIFLTLNGEYFPISEISGDVSVDNLDYTKIAAIRKVIKIFKNKETANTDLFNARTQRSIRDEIARILERHYNYDYIQHYNPLMYNILQSAISNYIDEDVNPKFKERKDIIIKKFIDWYDGRRTSDAERQAGSEKVVLNVCKNLGLSDIEIDCVRNIVEKLIRQEEKKDLSDLTINKRLQEYVMSSIRSSYENVLSVNEPIVQKLVKLAISNYIDRDVMPEHEENKQKIIDWAIKRFNLEYSSNDENAEKSTNVVISHPFDDDTLNDYTLTIPDDMNIDKAELTEIEPYVKEAIRIFQNKEKLNTEFRYSDIVTEFTIKIKRKEDNVDKKKIEKIMKLAASNYIDRDVMPEHEENKQKIIDWAIKRFNLPLANASDSYKKKLANYIATNVLFEREQRGWPKTFRYPSSKEIYKNQVINAVIKYSDNDPAIISLAIEKYKDLNTVHEELKTYLLKVIEEINSITNSNSNSDESNMSDPSPDETNDSSVSGESVYISGNVITERLSKKKTLKEVYKNLFSTRLY